MQIRLEIQPFQLVFILQVDYFMNLITIHVQLHVVRLLQSIARSNNKPSCYNSI